MIPRILHQCWIGTKPMPERESAWCAEMKRMNPSWTYRLWNNDLLQRYESDPYVKHLMSQNEEGKNTAFVMDRLRCLLLRDDGGVYLDADFQPLKPLDALNPLWDLDHVSFVYGHRSPFRPGVALWRGVIAYVDNSFLASAPQSRMIKRIIEGWNTKQPILNGGATGRLILEHLSHDCVDTGHRAFYDMQQTPDTVGLHDPHNLYSWGTDSKQMPVVRSGEMLKI